MSVSSVVAIASLVLALVTAAGSVLQNLLQGQQKRYAAERDFQHLKRNYEQLAENQDSLFREMEEKTSTITIELREMKMLLQTLLIQLSGDRDSSSGIFRGKKPPNDQS